MKNTVFKSIFCVVLILTVITSSGCGAKITSSRQSPVDYASESSWAYWGIGENKQADVFLVCPTVDMNDEWNMSMTDEQTKASFLGALNMERGIYEESARLFAPYYRQAAMKVYDLSPSDREKYMNFAYSDVSVAFSYYLEHKNDGRPIILAGFSQGADMCYRLMEEYFSNDDLSKRLVAVYAIGWPLTEEMTKKYPQLKAAQSETDIGTVISFECESQSVNDTFIVPSGTKALSINPLNWKTDSTAAQKEENIGACFTDYDGKIVSETKALCGGYIDEKRGVIKVTDVSEKDYPAVVPGLPSGAYHVYDYQFFYRNLQKNVADRLAAYISKVGA